MKAIRKILACIRRADETFHLIEQNDCFMLGISGGKDSMVLAYALQIYKRFSKKNFTFLPVWIDLGFPDAEREQMQAFFQSQGMELLVADAKTVFPILSKQKELMHSDHLPCSICSRMKKAAINQTALKHGVHKVAFAHHADDAIETLWMNEIFGGRVATFSPQMLLEETGITFIRPLLFARESEIAQCAKELQLPIFSSHCPNDRHTMREEIKILLNDLYKKYPEAKDNFLTMLTNYERFDLWYPYLQYTPLEQNTSLSPLISIQDYDRLIAIFPHIQPKYKEEQRFFLQKKNKIIGYFSFYVQNRIVEVPHFYTAHPNEERALLFHLESLIYRKYNPCTLKIKHTKSKFLEERGYEKKRFYYVKEIHKMPKES